MLWPEVAEWCGIPLPSEPSQHQSDHADLHLRPAGVRTPLVVPAVNPAAPQPGERPLHDPTPLDHPEALGPRRTAPDLDDVPAVLGDPAVQLVVVVLVV